MNLIHLFIPLCVLGTAYTAPFNSEHPVHYQGVSNSSDGYLMVHPEEDLGIYSGYGYVTDTDGTVSYNLRAYDYFAYLSDQYHGNSGLVSSAGSGFSYLENSSYLTLSNDLVVYSKVGNFNGDNYPVMSHDIRILTSAHVIIPDTDYVRSFRVSLDAGGPQAADYWASGMFPLDNVNAYLLDPSDLYNLDGRQVVPSFGGDEFDINVPRGYGVIFYHEWANSNSGTPYFYGYDVESIELYSGGVPSDWGADNLLTLFGYLFVGMSGILAIAIFPGITLGTALLFPLALSVLGLIWKITGN